MSRLAKNDITIVKGATVTLDGKTLTVKGPKGELVRDFKTDVIGIEIKDTDITLTKKDEAVFTRALWGTYASHIINMMIGVTEGYKKVLEIEGVGYRWSMKGKDIEILVGFSHPVLMAVAEGITVEIEKNTLTVSGIDKELVGQYAAKVRAVKKPEPYKGKGIRYQGEYIRRKQGKKTV